MATALLPSGFRISFKYHTNTQRELAQLEEHMKSVEVPTVEMEMVCGKRRASVCQAQRPRTTRILAMYTLPLSATCRLA